MLLDRNYASWRFLGKLRASVLLADMDDNDDMDEDNDDEDKGDQDTEDEDNEMNMTKLG